MGPGLRHSLYTRITGLRHFVVPIYPYTRLGLRQPWCRLRRPWCRLRHVVVPVYPETTVSTTLVRKLINKPKPQAPPLAGLGALRAPHVWFWLFCFVDFP